MASKLWLLSAQKGELLKLKSLKNTLQYLNIDCVTELNQSALMLAIPKNHHHVINYLIRIGCNLNIEDVFGENALSLAIRFKNRKLIKLLYQKGCRISEQLLINPDDDIKFELNLIEYSETWERVRTFVIYQLKHRRKYV